MNVRPAAPDDHPRLWEMLRVVRDAGDTYTFPPDMTRQEALSYWCGAAHLTFVAQAAGRVLGTYFLRPNQPGGGAHVCNAGFVTHPDARGQGVAQAMLDHALTTARAAGFRAMQFNFVVSTNEGAIRLWQRNGFDTVGRLPAAFRHPEHGYVDALVMYRHLV